MTPVRMHAGRQTLATRGGVAASGRVFRMALGIASTPRLCNSGTDDTTPVDQFPDGISSTGCLDMAGNVWEWTESERDDGHTRYAIIRGGSYLRVEGSIWYNASGANPTTAHEKMLLMYPGLDRCSTIGFRCVKDVA
ncbi:formylglycine-generating enzyme family protein [Chloroflexi bacterium TSY]|nr:formylglycine-generating enzyme family protein [Chloroflexi bacterium TSY]